MPQGVVKKVDIIDWNAFVYESDPEVNSGYTDRELDLHCNFSQETINIGFRTSH